MEENAEKFKPITIDYAKVDELMEHVGVIDIMVNQVANKSNNIQKRIANCLLMDPDRLEKLSLKDLDEMLLLLPKALIWLQDCENEAYLAYQEALDAFGDTIETKASLLPKSSFDVSTISDKMRKAKIRDLFPKEFEERTREIRTRQAIYTKLNGQVKHLERLNDNVKKIREGFVNRLKNDKGDLND